MGKSANVVDINRKTVSCEACVVNHKCFGYDPQSAAGCLFKDSKGGHQLLHRGDHLYRTGESFQALYMIRSGVIKTYFISEDGEEQILGFHLPGEIIGFDGIAASEFPSNATALDTTSVCKLSFDILDQQSAQSPHLQMALLKGMSQEILRHENMLMLLGKRKADQRLASFLLSRSTYQSNHGYSATIFTLSMTRTDIGKYLGLTVETVSRVLSRLQSQEVITVHTNQIHIHDLNTLRELCGDSVRVEASAVNDDTTSSTPGKKRPSPKSGRARQTVQIS